MSPAERLLGTLAEDPHLLGGLDVALGLGGRDTLIEGRDRLGVAAEGREGLAVELPGGRVGGVQTHRLGEVVHGPRRSWAILDDIKIWALIAVVLTIIVYGEVIWHYWPINDVSQGFRVW